jgi:hypothetical protein
VPRRRCRGVASSALYSDTPLLLPSPVRLLPVLAAFWTWLTGGSDVIVALANDGVYADRSGVSQPSPRLSSALLKSSVVALAARDMLSPLRWLLLLRCGIRPGAACAAGEAFAAAAASHWCAGLR